MRHVTSTIVACTLASAISVFAQDQAPAQPPAPPASGQAQPPAADQAPAGQAAPAEQAGPKSTLTGCVTQAKTTDGGTAYILTKAEGGSAPMYVLGGSPQTDWSANVNKKVEVIGPVQEPPNADKPADSKVLRPPAVIVESVKVVAESCK